MELVKHETCQQYVARRLSEGWSIVWQRGVHLILSSPDGNILRPVDLRNDVETLRPDGVGDYTNLESQSPDSTFHWDKVDEVTSDGYSTYISQYTTPEARDVYTLQATAIPVGSTINSVTVYFRADSYAGYYAWVRPLLRLGASETLGTLTEYLGADLALHSEVLARPGGGNWVIADLNSLQVGIGLTRGTTAPNSSGICTQIYVEVDYTPPTPQAVGGGAVGIAGVIARKVSASFGLGSIGIAGAVIKQTSITAGSGTVSSAGALIKKTLIGVGSGAMAISGALTTIWTQVIDVGSGAVSIAGILARKTSTSIGDGAVAIAGSLIKKTSASFGQGSIAITGALSPVRYYIKLVGQGTVSSAGILAKIIVARAQAVGDGAIAIAGSLAKETTRFRAVGDGAVAISGHAAKTMYQVCGGAFLDIRGYITQRSIYKAVGSGAIAIAGSLDEIKIKLQSVGEGAVTIVGALTKLPRKMVGSGAIAISGAVSKFPKKLVGGGAVTITGSVVKSISKSVGEAAVSIWGTVNGWLTGPPFRLILTFGQDWDLNLTFGQDWRLDLTFKGGSK